MRCFRSTCLMRVNAALIRFGGSPDSAHSGMRKPCFPDGGFSMVELLLTLVLLSIAMTIAVPSYRGWVDNTHLKDTTRTLTGDFAYLREAALASNQTHAIQCDAGLNSCSYSYDPGGSGTLTAVANYPSVRNLSNFGSGIQLTSVNPNRTLKVIARGMITPSATLQLTNNRGSVATITVQITGRTYVTYSMQ